MNDHDVFERSILDRAVTQPRISSLVCSKIDLFSIDTLIAMLDRAGVRVELTTLRQPFGRRI